jgi:hypothetical protein
MRYIHWKEGRGRTGDRRVKCTLRMRQGNWGQKTADKNETDKPEILASDREDQPDISEREAEQ